MQTSGAMPRVRFALLIALISTLVACTDLFAPAFPSEAIAFVPPLQYRTWWRMTESCAGISRNFDAVRWFRVPQSALPENIAARWYIDGNRIVLSSDVVRDGGMVRHEMLHVLLGRFNIRGHPHEYFVSRCGAVVACNPGCGLAETDRGVPADARTVPSESLTVSLAIGPQGAPAVSIDSGWVSFVITAINVRAEPVWVPLENRVTFGYVLAHEAGSYRSSQWSRFAFKAGEARSFVFDHQLTSVGVADTVWGFFGRAGSRPMALLLRP